jgi:positive regulator of sigma E activity
MAFGGESRQQSSGSDDQDLERSGVVVRTHGTRVWVRCDTSAGCPVCASGLGCRGGLLAALTGRSRLLEVDRGEQQVGVADSVRVAIPTAAINRAAMLVYGIPRAGVLLGAAAGALELPEWGDSATVTGAGAGFAAGVTLARRRLAATRLRPHLLTDRPSGPR